MAWGGLQRLFSQCKSVQLFIQFVFTRQRRWSLQLCKRLLPLFAFDCLFDVLRLLLRFLRRLNIDQAT